MKNLIQFLLRQHFLILFVLIEAFSLLILVNNNYFHKAKFFTVSRSLSANYYNNLSQLKDYIDLRKINEDLMEENTALKNKIALLQSIDIYHSGVVTNDSADYTYIPVKVINNSTNKQYNYITINKGEDHGIKEDMAVVSFDGFVGKVEAVSKRFSIVMSLLNQDMNLSVKLLNDNYAGSLKWTGKGYSEALLLEIPHHVELHKGDTIITSGFSDYYPEGIVVGTIGGMFKEGNFYNIIVDLSTDFKNLSYLTVIDNKYKGEQVKLLKRVAHD